MADALARIDLHAHFVPPTWLDSVHREGQAFDLDAGQDDSGGSWLRLGRTRPQGVQPALLDLVDRRTWMRVRGIDRQVLAPSMSTVGYHLNPRAGARLARLFNEAGADIARQDPSLVPVATVPLQASGVAVEELDHAVQHLGTRMVAIGTNVNGAELDDPSLDAFFRRAAEHGVLVLVHPNGRPGGETLRRYYFPNLVGNPMETTIAAGSLIFGGVLERYPDLRVCLVHGGGALPYIIGRLNHGYGAVKPARTIPQAPEAYARRFFYDTVVHSSHALTFLCQFAGAEQVVLGSDYPYDMGSPDPVGAVQQVGLPDADVAKILGGNAAHLLG